MKHFAKLCFLTMSAVIGASCASGSEEPAEPALSLSWEEFRANPPLRWEKVLAETPREIDEPYRYIVDGDIPLDGVHALREYYEAYLKQEYARLSGSGSMLTVKQRFGADEIWHPNQRNNLSYCISNSFSSTQKSQLIAAMASATDSWSSRIAVTFIYNSAQDSSCNTSNNNVLFNVEPYEGNDFHAIAFLPNSSRPLRRLRVADSAFTTTQGGRDLDGILRHELGHILGFVHEHLRVGCDTEDGGDTRVVTAYDVNSVMHYPECRPSESGGYRQTELDYRGAMSVYGQAHIWEPFVLSTHYSDALGWNAQPGYWDTIEYPDLNGDDRNDVCGRSAGGIQCALATGTGFDTVSMWTSNFTDAGGWLSGPQYWDTIEFPDLDGDGKQDVCGRSITGLYCALSFGTGFGAFTTWASNYSDANGWSSAPQYWDTIEYPDLNGDGKQDVCGRNTGGLQCALSTGSGFGAVSYWTTSYADGGGWNLGPHYWDTIEFPDLNGDDLADVCGRATGGLQCALSNGTSFGPVSYWTANFSDSLDWHVGAYYWDTIEYPDLNGDGSQDVCGRSVSGLFCALSSGTSFGSGSYWTANYSDAGSWYTAPHYWDTIEYPDLNNDGKNDVCGRAVDGLYCGLSTGSGFNSFSLWGTAYSDSNGWAAGPQHWDTIRYVDLNADGKRDVCGRAVEGLYCAIQL